MQEIGSEFWDCPIGNNNCFKKKKMQWYVSGRSALTAIIDELKNVRSVAMPSWCCESMIKPFLSSNIDIKYYPVYWDNGLVQELRYDCDVLYVMDYFGYSSEIRANHPLVIRDVTHSIFSQEYADADYYYGSLRKWAGVWTGGYAWAQNGHVLPVGNTDAEKYISLRRNAMDLKRKYLENEMGNDIKANYLSLFAEAENMLENFVIVNASERDVEEAERLDVDLIKVKRRKNAILLMEELKPYLMFPTLRNADCPLFVPLLLPSDKRERLCKVLISNQIYCPIHWGVSKYHKLSKREKDLYDMELSLVCDQRYNENDMARMVDVIKKFMKEN